MRILILIMLLCWNSSICLKAQNRAIEFEHMSFEKVLAKAREMKREVFLDCYTSWCGPCKLMAREVFTIDSVADYFNARFVNAKYDLEKEEQPLVKKYGIAGYPTFLVLDGNGKELYRLTGYHAPDEWMKLIRREKKSLSLSELENSYKSGDRSPAFMLAYMEALSEANQYGESKKVFAGIQLYHTEKDIRNRERWKLFSKYQRDLDAEDARFFISHINLFRDQVGGNEADAQLDMLYSFKVAEFAYWEQSFPGKAFDMKLLDSMITEIRMLDFDKSANTLAFLMMEKKIREKRYEEAVGFLKAIREVRLLNSTYYMQYFNIYADRLIGQKPPENILQQLNAECRQLLTGFPENQILWQKRYKLSQLLKDKEGQIECEKKLGL